MAKHASRTAREIAGRLKALGFICEGTTGGNHTKWLSPGGRGIVIVCGTPGDRRALQNTLRDAKHALRKDQDSTAP